MKFALVRTACVFVAALLFFSSPSASASTTERAPDAEAALFEFHSSFWRDLHHTLYAFASNASADAPSAGRIRLDPEDIAIGDALEDSEQAVWQSAVNWYASNLSDRDLLFDDEMVEIGEVLNIQEADLPDRSGIPAALREVLLRAAPVYRAHWWPRHHQANVDWQVAIEPLLAAHGRRIVSSLSRAYETAWFETPVPVALTAYSNWAGAYAVLSPTRVSISTLDRRNRNIAALEIAMHEASHGLVGALRQKLDAVVAAEAARPGANAAAVRQDLWHEILFYVTGSLVAEVVPGHVPYADGNKLWGRAWPERNRAILARHLDPYLAGSGSLETALQGLVRDLMSV